MSVPETEGGGRQPGNANKSIKLSRLNLEPQNDSEKEPCTRIKQKAHRLSCFLFTLLEVLRCINKLNLKFACFQSEEIRSRKRAGESNKTLSPAVKTLHTMKIELAHSRGLEVRHSGNSIKQFKYL